MTNKKDIMMQIKNNKKMLFNLLITIAFIAAGYLILNTLMVTQIISRYNSRIIMLIGINIILALSLNLVIGFTGQLTLGHGGFMAIGAYTAAILTLNLNMPFPFSLILGGLMAAFIALLIGIPILRLKGDYLAICTLAFGEIVRVLIENIKALGGARGIAGIPLKTNLFAVYVCVVLTIVIIRNIITSSQGRAIISVREDEIAAEAMGINTTKYKVIAFAIAAFFAGISGGLYAHYIRFIDPQTFNFVKSIEVLTFVVAGGMGSISGSVIGAVILTYLPEYLRRLHPVFRDFRMIIFAALLLILMLYRRQGIMGTKELSVDMLKALKPSNVAAKLSGIINKIKHLGKKGGESDGRKDFTTKG
jgi:branched-chain amino acid transport system permease protein